MKPDTWIFGDMSLIQEFYHPNITVLMGMWRSSRRTICAHSVAGGESSL